MDRKFFCLNCTYFKQHYYWNIDRLTAAVSGHCSARIKKPLVHDNDFCNKWELAENQTEQLNDDITKILRRTAKQINDIAAILKADK